MIGRLLSGVDDPRESIKDLSTGLLDENEKMVFTHARSLFLMGINPTPANILKRIRHEIWSSYSLCQSIAAYMDELMLESNSYIKRK